MSLQKGRPSKETQVQIIREIRPYFEKSFSATFTANKTGHDIKTVCKYFNEWSKQLIENEDKNFIQRQKEAKEQAIWNLDYIISEEYALLHEINEEIKNLRKNVKPIPKHLVSTKFLILREIAEMTQEKLALAMTPTLEVDIRRSIEKYMGLDDSSRN